MYANQDNQQTRVKSLGSVMRQPGFIFCRSIISVTFTNFTTVVQHAQFFQTGVLFKQGRWLTLHLCHHLVALSAARQENDQFPQQPFVLKAVQQHFNLSTVLRGSQGQHGIISNISSTFKRICNGNLSFLHIHFEQVNSFSMDVLKEYQHFNSHSSCCRLQLSTYFAQKHSLAK